MQPILQTLLNAAFPPRCPLCRATLSAHGALCAECWQKIAFIAGPMCAQCGHPFEYADGYSAALQCGECMRSPPRFTRARSVFRYDEHSRRLVTQLKFGDHTGMLATFGRWMNHAGAESIAAADAIVPVPLHYWRLLARRYNQAHLLAGALCKQTGLPLLPDAVTRVKRTKAQTGLTRTQREKNLRAAFAVSDSRRALVKHKKLVLIDDVMTTGATLNACANALIKAGAAEVHVITLARTMLGMG